MTRNHYGYPRLPAESWLDKLSLWDALAICASLGFIGWAILAGKAEVTRILLGVQR